MLATSSQILHYPAAEAIKAAIEPFEGHQPPLQFSLRDFDMLAPICLSCSIILKILRSLEGVRANPFPR
jgi:hypothetical protein